MYDQLKTSYRVSCLTPLWTGGYDQRMTEIRASSIKGSLRWWYEVIIRGLGYYACDPTDQGCIYDKKESMKSMCPVCQLFGCTGWAGRFRLRVSPQQITVNLVSIKSNPAPQTGNHNGWRIPNYVPTFDLVVDFPYKEDRSFHQNSIHVLLKFIEKYGALGAKTSQGQGIIKIGSGQLTVVADKWIKNLTDSPKKTGENPTLAPSENEFLGYFIQSDNKPSSLPISGQNIYQKNLVLSAPAFRAKIRNYFRADTNEKMLRHAVMGSLRDWAFSSNEKKNGPKGSDIFVSHFYEKENKWEMRTFAFSRETKVKDLFEHNVLKTHLQSLGQLVFTPYPNDFKTLLKEALT